MANIVHVKDISTQTTEKEVRDFFSFCGKINSLSLSPSNEGSGASQSATVAFEKETAAKTALLLDNTQLGPAHVHVTAASAGDLPISPDATRDDLKDDEVAQEDKPRSRIIAEYLAHGYVISDKAIENAISLDQQHGISTRFTNALLNFDSKYKATEKVQAADAKLGVSQTAMLGWHGLNSYFEKAMETPSGQKLRAFYEQGNKQVMDVHNEARHLANLKSGKVSTEPVPGTTSEPSSIDVEKAGMETVPGTEKTKCNCGGDTGKCPCVNCACANCAKNHEASV